MRLPELPADGCAVRAFRLSARLAPLFRTTRARHPLGYRARRHVPVLHEGRLGRRQVSARVAPCGPLLLALLLPAAQELLQVLKQLLTAHAVAGAVALGGVLLLGALQRLV